MQGVEAESEFVSEILPLTGGREPVVPLDAPIEPLREALRCIESLAGNEVPGSLERLRLLCALDDACQAPSRVCAASFLTQAAGPEREALRLTICDFWQTLLEAYELLMCRLAAPPELASAAVIASLGVRALRAGLHCARWMAFGGMALEDTQWRRLSHVFILARERAAEALAVSVRAGRTSETSVGREYLALIAQHSLCLQQLDAASVELGLRLARQALAQLEFGQLQGISSLLWVDPASGAPPARMINYAALSRGVYFFSAAAAIPALQRLLELAIKGRVPEELVPASGTVVLAAVLSYMIRQWSGDAPVRAHRRHLMPSPLAVVWGFPAVTQSWLAGVDTYRPKAGWHLRDISSSGMGIEVSMGSDPGAAIGVLLSVRLPEGAASRLGVVRRWVRLNAERMLLGVEFLGIQASLLKVSTGGQIIPAMAIDPLQLGVPLRLILPSGMANLSVLELVDTSSARTLQALTPAEPGADHVVRSYLPG